MANETTSEPSDFFASLVHDHRRFEVRLAELEQAAHAVAKVESDAAALAVIRATLDFFATDGTRHEEHEELTLFPRLRSQPSFKQILSALEFQHRMNDTEGRALEACVVSFAPGRGRELRRLALRFVEMHRGHAFAEERALFPQAASVLSPKVIAEMSTEVRERQRAKRPPTDPR